MAHTIGVIAGDGIGREVIPAGIAAIEKATRGTSVSVSFSDLPWSCEYYLKHQRMMDEDGYERMARFDALYMGALGAPGVSDAASAGLILGIRQKFDQYVNLRPMRLLAGLSSPLGNRSAADIDMICVRENSEGEYSGVGGRIHRGTAHEVAQQVGVFTRHGIERILRYGFEVASKRPRKMLASATKSNALTHSMVLWDEVAEIVRADYPAVEYRKYHVDALDRAQYLVVKIPVAEVFEHQRAGPDRADRVRDSLPRDVGRRAVDRFEHRRMLPCGVDVRARSDAEAA